LNFEKRCRYAGALGRRRYAWAVTPLVLAANCREATMLVLTRKSNQSIMIGDDIEVSVLAIMGEKVRIGIQAPRDIPVFRKEVYIEIQAEGSEGHKGAREEVDAALRTLGDRTDT
jgi:carbon storage regulator